MSGIKAGRGLAGVGEEKDRGDEAGPGWGWAVCFGRSAARGHSGMGGGFGLACCTEAALGCAAGYGLACCTEAALRWAESGGPE